MRRAGELEVDANRDGAGIDALVAGATKYPVAYGMLVNPTLVTFTRV